MAEYIKKIRTSEGDKQIDYTALANLPTIPASANNGTLTIQKNGTTITTFGANQSTNTTANITVPTKTSDITNDSGFITSSAIPSSLKNPTALTFGSKSYDGSVAKEITAADLGLSGAMKFLGTTTTAISDGSTTKTITVNGGSVTVTAGNVVLYDDKEFVWDGSKWEELGHEGSFKVKQTAVASPSASGSATAFIDTISQDANGNITATKKDVSFPVTSVAGKTGAVTLAKNDVGLGNVVNTGDSATPVSGGTTKFTTGGAYIELNKKVDKVEGKGLSTNDYTTAEKNKLAGIAVGAEVNVQSDWEQTDSTKADFIKNKPPIESGTANESLQSGTKSTATAERAFAQGYGANAKGTEAHAEGTYTQAIGAQSTASGLRTSALGQGATAQGEKTIAQGNFSSAEGVSTNQFANEISPVSGEIAQNELTRGVWNNKKFLNAQGKGSHAEGKDTFARGDFSHTEGTQTYTEGENAHAEGVNSKAFAANAHAEGNNTEVYAENAHGEGLNNTVYGPHTHAEGGGNKIGITGWYILAYDHSSHTIEVSKTQQNPPSSSLTGTNPDNLDLSSVLVNPDLFDIYVNGTYMHNIMVDVASGNTIRFTSENWNTSTGGSDGHDNEDRFNENYLGLYLDPVEKLRHDSNTIYCLNKPDIGPIKLKEGGHIEGRYNEVYSREGHAEGAGNTVLGNCAHAEGYQNEMGPWANNAHAEGQQNIITGSVAHVEGILNEVTGDFAHAEGNGNKASGNSAHIEGTSFYVESLYGNGDTEYSYSESSGTGSHVEGVGSSTVDSDMYYTLEAGELTFKMDTPYAAHAEGALTRALKLGGHSEGFSTYAGGRYAHAEGGDTAATGIASHSEGKGTAASGNSSHAEGDGSQATGNNAHAEGYSTTASGNNAHAEGAGAVASGESSHAEGSGTSATFHTAHAEGWKSTAEGQASHAEGNGTIANGLAQHVQGRWNVADNANKYAHIVGGGSSNIDRKNIHTVDWDGNAYFNGNLTLNDKTLGPEDFRRLSRLSENLEVEENPSYGKNFFKLSDGWGSGTFELWNDNDFKAAIKSSDPYTPYTLTLTGYGSDISIGKYSVNVAGEGETPMYQEEIGIKFGDAALNEEKWRKLVALVDHIVVDEATGDITLR